MGDIFRFAGRVLFGIGVLSILQACTTSDLLSSSRSNNVPASAQKVRLNVGEAMRKISKVRKRHGLGGISTDARLMRAARNHAKYLGRTGKFGHEFGPSTRFQKRMSDVGFKNSAGENLGVGYRNIDAAITGWMNSPKHRKIMLKRKFSIGGIALERNKSGKNPRYTYYWVLIMGSGGGGKMPAAFF